MNKSILKRGLLRRSVEVCVTGLSIAGVSPIFAVAYADEPDAFIVEIYQTYCQACHSSEGNGAPVAFDEQQWAKRLESGLEAVVNAAILGKGNMPAQGSCMECNYQDLEDLIVYMSRSGTE